MHKHMHAQTHDAAAPDEADRAAQVQQPLKHECRVDYVCANDQLQRPQAHKRDGASQRRQESSDAEPGARRQQQAAVSSRIERLCGLAAGSEGPGLGRGASMQVQCARAQTTSTQAVSCDAAAPSVV